MSQMSSYQLPDRREVAEARADNIRRADVFQTQFIWLQLELLPAQAGDL
jgi:hypothetical protein